MSNQYRTVSRINDNSVISRGSNFDVFGQRSTMNRKSQVERNIRSNMSNDNTRKVVVRVHENLKSIEAEQFKDSIVNQFQQLAQFQFYKSNTQLTKCSFTEPVSVIVIPYEELEWAMLFSKNTKKLNNLKIFIKCSDNKEVESIKQTQQVKCVVSFQDIWPILNEQYDVFMEEYVGKMKERRIKTKYFYKYDRDEVINLFYQDKIADLIGPYLLKIRSSKKLKQFRFNNMNELIKCVRSRKQMKREQTNIIKNHTKLIEQSIVTANHLPEPNSQIRSQPNLAPTLLGIEAYKDLNKMQEMKQSNFLIIRNKHPDLELIQRYWLSEKNVRNARIFLLDSSEATMEKLMKEMENLHQKDVSEQEKITMSPKLMIIVHIFDQETSFEIDQLRNYNFHTEKQFFSNEEELRTAILRIREQQQSYYGLLILYEETYNELINFIEKQIRYDKENQVTNFKIVLKRKKQESYDLANQYVYNLPDQKRYLITPDQITDPQNTDYTFLGQIDRARNIYYHPAEGLVGDNVYVFIRKSRQHLINMIRPELKNSKRVDLEEFNDIPHLQYLVAEKHKKKQTALVVTDEKELIEVMKLIRGKQNIYALVVTNHQSQIYDPQILKRGKEEDIKDFIAQIPEIEDEINLADLSYENSDEENPIAGKVSKVKQTSIQRKDDQKIAVCQIPGKPLIVIRIPEHKKQNEEANALIFIDRIKNHFHEEVKFKYYMSQQEVRDMDDTIQPLQFLIVNDHFLEWTKAMAEQQQYKAFEILFITQNKSLFKFQNLIREQKYRRFKLVTNKWRIIEQYIVAKAEVFTKKKQELFLDSNKYLHLFLTNRDLQIKKELDRLAVDPGNEIAKRCKYYFYDPTKPETLTAELKKHDPAEKSFLIINQSKPPCFKDYNIGSLLDEYPRTRILLISNKSSMANQNIHVRTDAILFNEQQTVNYIAQIRLRKVFDSNQQPTIFVENSNLSWRYFVKKNAILRKKFKFEFFDGRPELYQNIQKKINLDQNAMIWIFASQSQYQELKEKYANNKNVMCIIHDEKYKIPYQSKNIVIGSCDREQIQMYLINYNKKSKTKIPPSQCISTSACTLLFYSKLKIKMEELKLWRQRINARTVPFDDTNILKNGLLLKQTGKNKMSILYLLMTNEQEVELQPLLKSFPNIKKIIFNQSFIQKQRKYEHPNVCYISDTLTDLNIFLSNLRYTIRRPPRIIRCDYLCPVTNIYLMQHKFEREQLNLLEKYNSSIKIYYYKDSKDLERICANEMSLKANNLVIGSSSLENSLSTAAKKSIKLISQDDKFMQSQLTSFKVLQTDEHNETLLYLRNIPETRFDEAKKMTKGASILISPLSKQKQNALMVIRIGLNDIASRNKGLSLKTYENLEQLGPYLSKRPFEKHLLVIDQTEQTKLETWLQNYRYKNPNPDIKIILYLNSKTRRPKEESDNKLFVSDSPGLITDFFENIPAAKQKQLQSILLQNQSYLKVSLKPLIFVQEQSILPLDVNAKADQPSTRLLKFAKNKHKPLKYQQQPAVQTISFVGKQNDIVNRALVKLQLPKKTRITLIHKNCAQVNNAADFIAKQSSKLLQIKRESYEDANKVEGIVSKNYQNSDKILILENNKNDTQRLKRLQLKYPKVRVYYGNQIQDINNYINGNWSYRKITMPYKNPSVLDEFIDSTKSIYLFVPQRIKNNIKTKSVMEIIPYENQAQLKIQLEQINNNKASILNIVVTTPEMLQQVYGINQQTMNMRTIVLANRDINQRQLIQFKGSKYWEYAAKSTAEVEQQLEDIQKRFPYAEKNVRISIVYKHNSEAEHFLQFIKEESAKNIQIRKFPFDNELPEQLQGLVENCQSNSDKTLILLDSKQSASQYKYLQKKYPKCRVLWHDQWKEIGLIYDLNWLHKYLEIPYKNPTAVTGLIKSSCKINIFVPNKFYKFVKSVHPAVNVQMYDHDDHLQQMLVQNDKDQSEPTTNLIVATPENIEFIARMYSIYPNIRVLIVCDTRNLTKREHFGLKGKKYWFYADRNPDRIAEEIVDLQLNYNLGKSTTDNYTKDVLYYKPNQRKYLNHESICNYFKRRYQNPQDLDNLIANIPQSQIPYRLVNQNDQLSVQRIYPKPKSKQLDSQTLQIKSKVTTPQAYLNKVQVISKTPTTVAYDKTHSTANIQIIRSAYKPLPTSTTIQTKAIQPAVIKSIELPRFLSEAQKRKLNQLFQAKFLHNFLNIKYYYLSNALQNDLTSLIRFMTRQQLMQEYQRFPNTLMVVFCEQGNQMFLPEGFMGNPRVRILIISLAEFSPNNQVFYNFNQKDNVAQYIRGLERQAIYVLYKGRDQAIELKVLELQANYKQIYKRQFQDINHLKNELQNIKDRCKSIHVVCFIEEERMIRLIFQQQGIKSYFIYTVSRVVKTKRNILNINQHLQYDLVGIDIKTNEDRAKALQKLLQAKNRIVYIEANNRSRILKQVTAKQISELYSKDNLLIKDATRPTLLTLDGEIPSGIYDKIEKSPNSILIYNRKNLNILPKLPAQSIVINSWRQLEYLLYPERSKRQLKIDDYRQVHIVYDDEMDRSNKIRLVIMSDQNQSIVPTKYSDNGKLAEMVNKNQDKLFVQVINEEESQNLPKKENAVDLNNQQFKKLYKMRKKGMPYFLDVIEEEKQSEIDQDINKYNGYTGPEINELLRNNEKKKGAKSGNSSFVVQQLTDYDMIDTYSSRNSSNISNSGIGDQIKQKDKSIFRKKMNNIQKRIDYAKIETSLPKFRPILNGKGIKLLVPVESRQLLDLLQNSLEDIMVIKYSNLSDIQNYLDKNTQDPTIVFLVEQYLGKVKYLLEKYANIRIIAFTNPYSKVNQMIALECDNNDEIEYLMSILLIENTQSKPDNQDLSRIYKSNDYDKRMKYFPLKNPSQKVQLFYHPVKNAFIKQAVERYNGDKILFIEFTTPETLKVKLRQCEAYNEDNEIYLIIATDEQIPQIENIDLAENMLVFIIRFLSNPKSNTYIQNIPDSKRLVYTGHSGQQIANFITNILHQSYKRFRKPNRILKSKSKGFLVQQRAQQKKYKRQYIPSIFGTASRFQYYNDKYIPIDSPLLHHQIHRANSLQEKQPRRAFRIKEKSAQKKFPLKKKLKNNKEDLVYGF